MNKTTKILLGIAIFLGVVLFFLPRFFSTIARDALHKQFPQVEITVGELTLGWFSLNASDISLTPKQQKEDSMKIKKLHVSFNPWELPHKKVKDIEIHGIEVTNTSGNIVTIAKAFQASPSSPSGAPQVSPVSASSGDQSNHAFNFKTIKIGNLQIKAKIGSDIYKAVISGEAAPINRGVKGQIKTDITTPYGLIQGTVSFVATEKLTADITAKAKEVHYENIKIESPTLTLKIEKQPYAHFKGFLATTAEAINYEYSTQRVKIPLRIPKGHLEGPVQITVTPAKKGSLQLVGEVGRVPLGLKGHYNMDTQSGHVDLKPIKVPLTAPWLQGILSHMAPVKDLDLKHLDGALALHSYVDITKGVITPHYTIKIDDTGKVITAVVETALKNTLQDTITLPAKTVDAVGGFLGKLFS